MPYLLWNLTDAISIIMRIILDESSCTVFQIGPFSINSLGFGITRFSWYFIRLTFTHNLIRMKFTAYFDHLY